MVKPLSLSFKIIIFVFLFLGLGINFGAPIFAQEVSFFIEDEGYFGWPVYGKVSIKLLNPGDSCHAEIEFGDNSTPFTMDCNFPTGGDSGSYFLCEHKFMHIYPGPEGRYPLHFGPGSNCMRLEGFGEPPGSGVICRVIAHFTCADDQTKYVFLYSKESPTLPTQSIPTSPIQATSLEEFISRITNILYWLLSSILFIIILIGGIQILASQGNPQLIQKGRKTIIFALLGFSLITLARGLFLLFEVVLGVGR